MGNINRSEYLDDYGLQVDPLFDIIDEQQNQIDKLNKAKDALIITRGQWIHSVNAKQCLEALAELKG